MSCTGTNICTIWFTYLYYENMVQFFIPFSGVEFQFIERYPNIVRILGGYMHDMPPIHFPPESQARGLCNFSHSHKNIILCSMLQQALVYNN